MVTNEAKNSLLADLRTKYPRAHRVFGTVEAEAAEQLVVEGRAVETSWSTYRLVPSRDDRKVGGAS